jgi:hypothetical protein
MYGVNRKEATARMNELAVFGWRLKAHLQMSLGERMRCEWPTCCTLPGLCCLMSLVSPDIVAELAL